jgi:hypothetical protein
MPSVKKSRFKSGLARMTEGNLVISHSIHEKTIVQNFNQDEGLDNLVNKYKLLHAEAVKVNETKAQREIILPLFDQMKAIA